MSEIITDEDNLMLIKLIASLNISNYQDELDWEGLMSSLDVVHLLGADICIIFGHSVYISLGERYYNRVPAGDNLGDSIFNAMNHFSLWYLKHNQ